MSVERGDRRGWTAEATDVLDRACERHGGLAAWRAASRIRLETADFGGMLPRLKGAGSTFRFPPRLDIFPHEGRVVFDEYPGPGRRGIFEADGSVRVESASAADVPARGPDHRATFGPVSRNRRWSPLDALYFFGYAVLHYHSLPFTLGEGELLSIDRRGGLSGEITMLRVRLPRETITHCPVQTFHFDNSGLLVRHDYTADVVGPWARGAHLWEDHGEAGGILVAMQRRVLVRVAGVAIPVDVLHARFASAGVFADE